MEYPIWGRPIYISQLVSFWLIFPSVALHFYSAQCFHLNIIRDIDERLDHPCSYLLLSCSSCCSCSLSHFCPSSQATNLPCLKHTISAYLRQRKASTTSQSVLSGSSNGRREWVASHNQSMMGYFTNDCRHPWVSTLLWRGIWKIWRKHFPISTRYEHWTMPEIFLPLPGNQMAHSVRRNLLHLRTTSIAMQSHSFPLPKD